jgi:hypothetical protein
MKLLHQIALTTETRSVKLKDLVRVSAALQKQASRDLKNIWGVNATVDAFARLEDVPLGYWPMIVVEDVQGAAGVHLDKDGQPFALIEAGPSWSLTASHECLEMLVDPFGDRVVAGPSVKPGQGRVEYLVEVCDPSEDDAYAYTVNGVVVSDFYTPQFFDPMKAGGVRYSYGGHVQAPRQVLPGGYLSWHEPVSDHWWQQTWFTGSKPVFRDLGIFSASDPRSVREIVDSLTPELERLGKLPASSKIMSRTQRNADSTEAASESKADLWRTQIKEIRLRAEQH